MINGVQTKICGLKSVADAQYAIDAGADYLGFILWPKSPRYIPLAEAQAIAPQLIGNAKRVAVVVEPSMGELEELKAAGFDYYQVHFPNETPFFEVALWTEVISPTQLWLAPKALPGKSLDPAFFPLADMILVDTFKAEGYGGTGQTGDWAEFVRLRSQYTKVNWVLAGGLNPENITAAIKATGAQIVDVNSGVESAPGVKDHAKITALFDALKAAPVS